MKLMHLEKPSKSTVSSALNGVAMIGHTPVKLAIERLPTGAIRRMQRVASIAVRAFKCGEWCSSRPSRDDECNRRRACA